MAAVDLVLTKTSGKCARGDESGQEEKEERIKIVKQSGYQDLRFPLLGLGPLDKR
ncbi:hypothetical protein CC2G_002272 [Coprinopsis cinerea AmutBmut pab1-1]|nr:hypothetical protein CC2G_002272 [Coprinopsis cinerea AmutBmut pab1-1]